MFECSSGSSSRNLVRHSRKENGIAVNIVPLEVVIVVDDGLEG